jgi:hypothetical protein
MVMVVEVEAKSGGARCIRQHSQEDRNNHRTLQRQQHHDAFNNGKNVTIGEGEAIRTTIEE